MKCALCSFEFDEERARRSCRKCFKIGSCTLIRCPQCGYEFPPQPQWLKRMSEKLKRKTT